MSELNTSKTPNINTIKIIKILLTMILILILATMITIGFTFLKSYKKDKNTIMPNSKLSFYNKVYDISAKNVGSVREHANSTLELYSKKQMKLLYNSNIEDVPAEKLGIIVDYNKLRADLNKITFNSNVLDYISQKNEKSAHKINLNNYIKFNFEILKKYINKNIAEKYYLAPVNATLKLQNKKFVILPSKEGYKVDEDKLYSLMIKEIIKNKFGSTKIPLVVTEPNRKESDVPKMIPTQELASFSTDYGFSTVQRKGNIGIASSKINNILLEPNETFEFYKAIGGKPTAAKGFQQAPVYVNGKVDSGIGGGMCQVSTTLYNTALRANLKMVERYNHALPVHYIPLGLDAAVSYGCNTLRFTNSTEGYLLIKSKHDGKRLSFSILGSKKLDKKIKVYSIIKSPKEADAYREVYDKNNNLIKKEHLHKDKYK